MPDIASKMSWLPAIADAWAGIENRPNVITLTHHYYFGGPPSNPEVNIPNLLKPATMAKVQTMADMVTAAADKMHVRVRMTEGNTCDPGGKPGCRMSSRQHSGPQTTRSRLPEIIFRDQSPWRHRVHYRERAGRSHVRRRGSQSAGRDAGRDCDAPPCLLFAHCIFWL